ncbi:MAG: response regulator transcription factor [Nitrospinae bacterium]|nr:response regulator transcription factor [Nitrospinota bacterium]
MTNPDTATLFMADDHPIFLEGLRRIIDKKRFRIVGDAANGKEALEKILALQPDIALLDISMPELTGICVARELRKRKMKTKVVLLSSHDDQKHLDDAIKLDIRGYMLKDNTGRELADALAYVLDGNTYISPILSARILKNMTAAKTRNIAPLTAAEKGILALLAENKTSQEIASILHCSPRTVETHRANICGKLQLKGHNALLNFALKHLKK